MPELCLLQVRLLPIQELTSHFSRVLLGRRIVSEVAARGARRGGAATAPLAQPPPRCSRSASLNLLIAPTEPEPGDLRGAFWLQSRVETAARTCLWAACGLPATAPVCCLTAAERLCLAAHCNLSAWALLQRLHPCSGPVQSGGSQGCPKVLELLRVALGGCGNVRWVTVVRFEWSTGF